jgi:DNA repair protein RadA/Sms
MLSIQSSVRNKALPKGLLVFGEVGLAGEVRPAPKGVARIEEAVNLGFSQCIIPRANAPKKPIAGLTVHSVDRVEQALTVARSL